MRNIKVTQGMSGSHFRTTEPSDDTEAIACAYNLAKACNPDCAACSIKDGQMFKTATCNRGSFDVGAIKS